ncbi:hypothetical protein B0H13DRAFT_810225 [Mycena leptocephala]|nr:hypothetical protein B0H13DRAFT_810225 [Mycena leptocephala]
MRRVPKLHSLVAVFQAILYHGESSCSSFGCRRASRIYSIGFGCGHGIWDSRWGSCQVLGFPAKYGSCEYGLLGCRIARRDSMSCEWRMASYSRMTEVEECMKFESRVFSQRTRASYSLRSQVGHWKRELGDRVRGRSSTAVQPANRSERCHVAKNPAAGNQAWHLISTGIPPFLDLPPCDESFDGRSGPLSPCLHMI